MRDDARYDDSASYDGGYDRDGSDNRNGNDAPDAGADGSYSASDSGYDARGVPNGNGAGPEDEAVDACSAAAEDQGRQYASNSHVTDVTDVDPADRGGYYVQGTLELRDGYRNAGSVSHRFRCSTVDNGDPRVVIDGLDYAQR